MKIVICGGGTSGWLSALFLTYLSPNNEYILIESSSIGTIGVGEGSTGLLRDVIKGTIHDFGLKEHDFFLNTDAVPKLGIQFNNWGSKSYISPIDGSPTAEFEIDYSSLVAISRGDGPEFSSRQGIRAIAGHIPYTSLNELWNNNLGGAYHFDGVKLGNYLKDHVTDTRDNIKVIDSEIESIESESNIVSEIKLSNSEIISDVDLVIDCLGLDSIFNKTIDKGWVDYSKHLPVDSAIVFRKRNENVSETRALTDAIAMKNGWMFKIPVGNRYGCGYIYSSKFCNEDEARKELEDEGYDITESRKLSFKSGRLKEIWKGNVVAMGLSSGFLEPLQATSLHTTISHLKHLAKNVVACDPKVLSTQASGYNTFANQHYDSFVDFINLHYQCDRKDTDFWRYMTTKSKTKKVKEIIDTCKGRLPFRKDHTSFDGAATDLWNATLHGLDIIQKEVGKKQLEHYYAIFDNRETIESEYEHHIWYFTENENVETMKNFMEKYYG